MMDQPTKKNELCCVNFDIEINTTKRNKRDLILSIEFSEAEIDAKLLLKHKLRLALKRCQIALYLHGCILPTKNKTNISPLRITSTTKLVESSENKNKKSKENRAQVEASLAGGKFNAGQNVTSGIDQTKKVGTEDDIITNHVIPGGSDDSPTWTFAGLRNNLLIGQLLKQSLGELEIQDRPASISGITSIWKKDIILTDAEGVFSKSIIKKAVATAYILGIIKEDLFNKKVMSIVIK